MSFVDLMADVEWSDADIRNRTETMLEVEFDRRKVDVLRRQLEGAMTGMGPALTTDEQAQLGAYGSRAMELGYLADAARADMALLRQAKAVEGGTWGDSPIPQAVADLVALRAAQRPAQPLPEVVTTGATT